MLSIAELAHQRDPQAIAEIIRQELKLLDSSALEVEVAIVDSSLEIQIRTDSAIDKEKLLALVRSELENLHIESLAKFRIHCWRNDVEMHEQRLLWTEQSMLNLPKLSLTQTLELDTDQSNSLAETRSHLRTPERISERRPEAQLSKHSVLQQAIAQIAPDSKTAKTNLLAAESENDNEQVTQSPDLANALNPVNFQANPTSDVNYWQLIFIGASIVLLGLGIGAFVRAFTSQQDREFASTSATSPITRTTSTNKVKNTNQSSPIQSSPQSSQTVAPSPSTISPKPSPLSSTEAASPSPTDLSSPDATSASPSATQEDMDVITLEKFNRVQKGMTLEQVEKVLGKSGKVIAENSSSDSIGKVYSWKNPQGSNAIIEFKDGLVIAKAQAGL